MKRLAELREHLLAAPLGLKADTLVTFVNLGNVHRHVDGESRSLRFTYPANVIAEQFSGNPVTVALFLWDWLEEFQPGLAPDAVTFEADILNTDAADIAFSVRMSETWAVETVDGEHRLTLQPEPRLDTDSLTGFSEGT